MRFESFSFGSIHIDGVTYTHDVMIDRGQVRKRKKKPSKKFRNDFGHTPLSMEEDIPWMRITVTPQIFGGKPIIRGRRLAVEHVLGMLAAGDSPETIMNGYLWLEHDDIRACLVYARKLVAHERVEPAVETSK